MTGRDITIGSVYATLDRLEAKGLVASHRTAGAEGSSRRVFAVTPAGEQALAQTRTTAIDCRQASGCGRSTMDDGTIL